MTDPSRRDLLAALCSATATGVAGCIRVDGPLLGGSCPSYEPVEASTTDWTSRFGNPAGTARVTAAAAPDDSPSLDWMAPIETSRGNSVPVVADGTVYVHDVDRTLLALDAATGDEQWRSGLPQIVGTPALGDGTMVVRTKSGVSAVETTTGDPRWSAVEQFETWTAAHPIVADGAAFVTAGVTIYALEIATGEIRWRLPIGLPTHATPAVAGPTVYVASDDTYVRALSTAEGVQRWRAKTDGQIRCNVSVANGLVCTGTETGDVIALEAADGTERWRHQLPDAKHADRPARPRTVTTDGARVYVTTDDVLWVLNAGDGSQCWRTYEYRSDQASAVAVADDTLYAPTDHPDEWFTAYGAASGDVRQRWEPDVDPFFSTGPSLANGALYTAGGGAVARFS